MRRLATIVAVALLILAGTSLDLAADDGEAKDPIDYSELSIYELLNLRIESTSSRRETKITESPASITVITREDLESSWATNIPDLLRNTLGVDVIGVSAGTHMTSLRGSNPFSSLKVGILIDGQSVEPLIYGTNTWNQLPLSLQDIDRIEVVRSPGSVLYGANALYGVVNFITRPPTDEPTTTVSYTFGDQYDTSIGTVTTSGKIGRFGYRVGLGLMDISQDYPWTLDTETMDRVADDHIIANALVTHVSDDGSARWTATFANNHYEHFNRLPDRLCTTLVDGDIRYGRLRYEKDFSRQQSLTVSLDLDSSSFRITNNGGWGTPATALAESDIPDFVKKMTALTVEYSRPAGKNHLIVAGIQGKLEQTEDRGQNSFFTENVRENIYAAFIQDRISLSSRFFLDLGLRVSNHYITNTSFSGMSSLLYRLSNNHSLRVSATRAIREPNVYETKMDFALTSGYSGKYGVYMGGEDADVEVNNAFELSYKYATQSATFEATAFLYDGRDVFDNSHVGNTTVNDIYVPVYLLSNYISKAKTSGLEVGGQWSVTDKLVVFANSTYQDVEIMSTVPESPTGRYGDEYAPRIKANVGMHYYPFKWLKSSVSANYVDEVTWLRYAWSPETGVETVSTPSRDSYTSVNLYLGVFPTDFLSLSVKVSNLLDDDHKDWPISSSGYLPRRAVVQAAVVF